MDVDKKTRLEPFSFPDGQNLTIFARILTEITSSNPH